MRDTGLWWACAREGLWSLNIISSAVSLLLPVLSLLDSSSASRSSFFIILLPLTVSAEYTFFACPVTSGVLVCPGGFSHHCPLYHPEWLSEVCCGSRDILGASLPLFMHLSFCQFFFCFLPTQPPIFLHKARNQRGNILFTSKKEYSGAAFNSVASVVYKYHLAPGQVYPFLLSFSPTS